MKLNGDQHSTDTPNGNVAAELLFCSEYLDGIESVRIAQENRLRSMAHAYLDDPGVIKGLSGKKLAKRLETEPRPLADYAGQLAALCAIEHEAELALGRVLRRHPLGPWCSARVGIGAKQGARLLAAIGPISWNGLDERPRRGPAELWAYCGYRPGQKRQKGVKSNWNATAKSRAFLVAASCVRNRNSPYRPVYDRARESWDGRDVKDGHKDNHARRLVAKAILRDLFVEAKHLGV